MTAERDGYGVFLLLTRLEAVLSLLERPEFVREMRESQELRLLLFECSVQSAMLSEKVVPFPRKRPCLK